MKNNTIATGSTRAVLMQVIFYQKGELLKVENKRTV